MDELDNFSIYLANALKDGAHPIAKCLIHCAHSDPN